MKTIKPIRVESITDTLRTLEVGDKCPMNALRETSIRCAMVRESQRSGAKFSARREGDKLIVTRVK